MKNRRKKSRGFSFAPFLLLLPALILGVYGLLFTYGIIPSKVELGAFTVEFFAMGENAIMVFLAKLCFVWLPVLFVVFLVLGLIIGAISDRGARGADKEAEANKVPDAMPKRRDGARGQKVGAETPEEKTFEAEATGDPDGGEAKNAAEHFPVLKKLERDRTARVSERNGDKDKDKVKEYPPISLKDALVGLRTFSTSEGIEMTERTALSLLASVCASRMTVTDERSGEKSRKAMEAVAAYFGGTLHPYHADAGSYAAEHLTAVADADGGLCETGLLIDIYSACLDSERLSFAFLGISDCGAVSTFFSEYRAALEGGLGGRFVTVDRLRRSDGLAYIKNGKVLFPENLTLAVSAPLSADITRLYGEAVYPETDGIVFRPRAVYGGHEIYARAQIMKAVERARDKFYLTDEHWNGIDRIEEFIFGVTGQRFGNRKIRMMERYSSVYMAAGGSETDALDSMLVACVLSELYSRRAKFNTAVGKSLPELLEGVFGAETVPASVEMARRICGVTAKPEVKPEEITDGAEDKAVSTEKETDDTGAPAIESEKADAVDEEEDIGLLMKRVDEMLNSIPRSVDTEE